MATKQVGWYNLKEETVFHDNGYECAAWYENVRVPAGRYPAVIYDYRVRDDGHVDGKISGSLYASMDGITESDYFGSLFCGVPIGTYDCEKNKGRKSHYTIQSYGFMVAQSILDDPDTPWELLPEYEAREYQFTYDGKEYTHWGIFLRGGENA